MTESVPGDPSAYILSLPKAELHLHLEGTVDHMMEMIHAHPTVWEAMGDGFASVRGLQINV